MCLLKKSLYGLKQSPSQWCKLFDSFMIKVKYNRCEYDSYVYFKQDNDPTYLLLYVDDMLIAARNKIHVQKLKVQLKKEFDMKDLGEAKKILRMKITRDRGSGRLWLSQENMFSRCWRDLTWQKQDQSLLLWQVTSNYSPNSVHNQRKRRKRCFEYHMLVRWDHSYMLWSALGLT